MLLIYLEILLELVINLKFKFDFLTLNIHKRTLVNNNKNTEKICVFIIN